MFGPCFIKYRGRAGCFALIVFMVSSSRKCGLQCVICGFSWPYAFYIPKLPSISRHKVYVDFNGVNIYTMIVHLNRG